MKKTLLFLASLAILAVSCEKQQPIVSTVSEDGVFTCSFEGTKTSIDSDGCPKWQEGDFIILYNGAKANSANLTDQTNIRVLESDATLPFYVMNGSVKEAVTNNIIEKIDITSSMISPDGTTVTFSKTIDDAADCYYAIVESKGSALVYNIAQSGKVTFREAKTHSMATQNAVHVALAKCGKSESTLNFKNLYCQMKFCVPQGKYTKVTFEANTGSTNTFVCGMNGVNFDLSNLGTAQSKTDPYTVNLGATDGDQCYVPVASTAVLDKGITIKCYKSATDADPLVVSTSKAIPVVRNRMINLGNLEETTPVTSYYEAYQAGKDVIIGGKSYNKATYGDGIHITADTNLADHCEGIHFVDEGVKLCVANGYAKPYADFIVLCDKPGAKATMEIKADAFRVGKSGIKYIFSNMIMDFTSKNSITYGSNVEINAEFYNCKISSTVYFTISSSSKVTSVVFDGCDIAISQASGIVPGNIDHKTQSVTIRNCQVYSPVTDTQKQFVFCTKKVTEGVVASFGTVTIENNTFYNINWNNSNYHGLVNPKSVDAFYLKNNIFAFSKSTNSYYRVLYLSTDDDTNTTGYPSSGEFSGNVSWNNGICHFGCYNASTRLSWYSASYHEFTYASESPFESADVSTGTFVKKAAYSSVGATR